MLKDAVLLFKYFKKNGTVHKYPVPKDCLENYIGERLLRTPPIGYVKCSRCFSELPM